MVILNFMKIQKLVFILLAIVILLSGCSSAEEDDRINMISFRRSNFPVEKILELIKVHNDIFAVAEVEIVSIVPRNTYNKYDHPDLFRPISGYIFYNAKITKVYYEDDDFFESDNIIFLDIIRNESGIFQERNKFIALISSLERDFGETYSGVYSSFSNPDVIFSISTISDQEYIIRNADDANKNIFNLDLADSQKETLGLLKGRGNSRIEEIEVEEVYVAEYDKFAEALTEYVRVFFQEK